MPLFVEDFFTSCSGLSLNWKIECDGLTEEDWNGAARIAVDFLPPFGEVYGIPRGGIPFAKALEKYRTLGATLIVDDVLTTGTSFDDAINRVKDVNGVIGCVLFARGVCPDWVIPIFSLPKRTYT